MAWSQISSDFIQYQADASGTSASGYYLKCYAAGTSTPISIALGGTGAPLVDKVQLDSEGFAQNASGGSTALFIDQDFRLVLFLNSTDADNNTFANAVQDIDDIPQPTSGESAKSDIKASAEYVKNFAVLVDAVNDTGLVENDILNIAERTSGNAGGFIGDVVLASSVTPNTYNIVQCVGAPTLAIVVRDVEHINAKQWGALGDGVTNDYDVFVAIEADVLTSKRSVYMPAGTYELGANAFPFRNTDLSPTSLKDYDGITVFGESRGTTIVRTTSDAGKDVLQVNATKGISFRDFSVTAILTDTIGAGSNCISITNGGEDLEFLVDVFDAPSIDQVTFLDGGKGYTIQTGSTDLPTKNIRIQGKATNCGFGFGIDVPYARFDLDQLEPIEGVVVDIVAEDCWRACVISAAAATGTVNEVDKDCGLQVRVTAINCAQTVVMGRWVNAEIDAHVANTKDIAALYKPFAADQTVYAADIEGDFGSKVSVTGRMKECDNKLIVGGTTQGGGVFNGCKNLDLLFGVTAESVVSGNDISVLNVGGNVATNCEFKLSNITDTTYTGLLEVSGILKPEWENTVILQAIYLPQQQEVQQFSVPFQGQSYKAFEVDAVTGDVKFLRSGSGGAGSADGFMTIKDTNTGTTYKIQLYT